MIIDANKDGRSFAGRDFDVCVIGSGPAGITLARALAAQGVDVALMEAGELEWSEQSQQNYEGENIGLPYHDLGAARLRYFGGTSGHWNGVCRALDETDFKPRAANPGSGWPIAKSDLDPYQAQADEILDTASVEEEPDFPPGPEGEAFREIRFRRSAPTRFGEKYHDEIAASGQITLCLNANLVDLKLDDGLSGVTEAVFKSYDPGDPGFSLRAKAFCLCAGGIENARLLLNFRGQMPGGIGNGHDLVGRYFCEHPSLYLGELIYEEMPELERHSFIPTEDFLAENGTLPLSLNFNHRVRVQSKLVKETLRSAQCNIPFAERLAEAVLGGEPARCDRGGLADYFARRDPEANPWALVTTNSEQSLNPGSRVLLSEETDMFGLAKANLDWQLTGLDYRSVKVATLAMAEYVARRGIGRMRIYDWLLEDNPVLPKPHEYNGNVGSWHHMCTTRMSDDPGQGVVDRDCRVHGISNLYIGGSSVFASAGYANPTYTIVQLALRLADHLGEQIRA